MFRTKTNMLTNSNSLSFSNSLANIIMQDLKVPSSFTVDRIVQQTAQSLEKRFKLDNANGIFGRKICAVCDCFVTVDNEEQWIPANDLATYCSRSNASHEYLSQFFPEKLMSEYVNNHPLLKDYVVSPHLCTRAGRRNMDEVLICSACCIAFKNTKANGLKKKSASPMRAIWNGNLIGESPAELRDLNIVELALVSPNRIMSHGIVLYADQHKGVYGWHALYENNIEQNVSNIEQLVRAGLTGEIVCVMCGPFTKTQKMFARSHMTVRYEYIRRAFEWLKSNNHFFYDMTIPEEHEVRGPVILYGEDL